MPFKALVITVENTQVNQVLHCPIDYKEDLQSALHDWQLQTITITHIEKLLNFLINSMVMVTIKRNDLN